MDWLTFTATMTGHLASIIGHLTWPFVVMLLLWFFGPKLMEVIRSLTKLKYKEFEAEFNNQVEKITDEAKEIRKTTDLVDEPVREEIVDLLERHPDLAIIEAWKPLEKAVVELSSKKFDTPGTAPFMAHLDALRKNDIIDPKIYQMIIGMRKLRNQAVHEADTKLPKARVYEFLDTIADVASYLNRFLL